MIHKTNNIIVKSHESGNGTRVAVDAAVSVKSTRATPPPHLVEFYGLLGFACGAIHHLTEASRGVVGAKNMS